MAKPRLQTLKPQIGTLKANSLPTLTPGSWRSSDMTSADRGYDYRWRKARERYLRAHPLCVYCQRQGVVTAATVVDHKTPHRGDKSLFWSEDNWQSLCVNCHSSAKQAEENAQK